MPLMIRSPGSRFYRVYCSVLNRCDQPVQLRRSRFIMMAEK